MNIITRMIGYLVLAITALVVLAGLCLEAAVHPTRARKLFAALTPRFQNALAFPNWILTCRPGERYFANEMSAAEQQAKIQFLVNEQVRSGASYDEAFAITRVAHPELFANANACSNACSHTEQKQREDEISQNQLRMDRIRYAIQEIMNTTGYSYDEAYQVVRRERPELFRPLTPSTARK